MLLSSIGWQTLTQIQSREILAGSSDSRNEDGEDEDEDGDSVDGELEAHLLFRRSSRESRPTGAGVVSVPMLSDGTEPRLAGAVPEEPNGAARSLLRLPLRC